MMYFIMAIYQTVVHIVDFLVLCFMSNVIILQAIFHLFYPPKMKSVIGEVVLVSRPLLQFHAESKVILERLHLFVIESEEMPLSPSVNQALQLSLSASACIYQ